MSKFETVSNRSKVRELAEQIVKDLCAESTIDHIEQMLLEQLDVFGVDGGGGVVPEKLVSGYYTLDGKTIKPVTDIAEWLMWYRTANRIVAKDTIMDVYVVTAFLGRDYACGQSDQPLVFETMVVGGQFDQEEERYSTWDEAEAGHQQWVAKVKASELVKLLTACLLLAGLEDVK